MASYRFKPWIGSRYRDKPTRLLVVGESHYGSENDDYPDFTVSILDRWRSGERFRFFTKLARLLSHKAAADVQPESDLEDAAFYNYVQVMMPWNNKGHPGKEDYDASVEHFRTLLSELDPTHVLVLSRRAYSHMPPALDEDEHVLGGKRCPTCRYPTPSGSARVMNMPHISRPPVDPWMEAVAEFRALNPLTPGEEWRPVR